MNIFKVIYTVTIYENGKFSWKVIKRNKTSNEIANDFMWVVAVFVICCTALLVFK